MNLLKTVEFIPQNVNRIIGREEAIENRVQDVGKVQGG